MLSSAADVSLTLAAKKCPGRVSGLVPLALAATRSSQIEPTPIAPRRLSPEVAEPIGASFCKSADSIRFQMIQAQFFALNVSNGAIGESLLGYPILDHPKNEPIRWRRQHAHRNDSLASRPPPKLFEALLR
jgi:hypothetical protein